MGSSTRVVLRDGSFVDWSIARIRADKWRPHGIRYRIAWIQNGKCRVLADNHHGKRDHFHVDNLEERYEFVSVEQLWSDFGRRISELGASI